MKRWLAVAGVVLVAATVPGVVRSGQAVPSHQTFGRGDCASCHDTPPRYHAEDHWDLNHGRTALPVQERCASCHAPSSCLSCHGVAPATHTDGFRAPGSSSPGAERHILVGRTQPSSCLVCHRDLATDCVKCHTVTEVQPWIDEGREALAPWQHLLGRY